MMIGIVMHPGDFYAHTSDLVSAPLLSTIALVYDIPSRKITTLLGFSKGHWENNKEAHGDKRNPEDLARWRKLAKIGIQTDRHLLSEQAIILEDFWGPADLLPVSMDMPTL